VAHQQLDNGSVSSQTLQVKVGDQVVGNFSTTGASSNGYVLFTSDAFKVANTGAYPIAIAGTNLNGGDNTALISDIQVTGLRPGRRRLLASKQGNCRSKELTNLNSEVVAKVYGTEWRRSDPAMSRWYSSQRSRQACSPSVSGADQQALSGRGHDWGSGVGRSPSTCVLIRQRQHHLDSDRGILKGFALSTRFLFMCRMRRHMTNPILTRSGS
jgi:hypothetical protein